MILAGQIVMAVRQTVPTVLDLSIGDENDKSTWTFTYTAAATDADKAAVATWVANYDANKQALIAYANAKQQALASGTVTVQGVPISLNELGSRNLQGAVSLAGLIPTQVFHWDVDDNGTAAQLTAAQVTSMGQSVGLFVQATYTSCVAAKAGINSGSITDTAGVDAVSWPSTTL
jgi:hypothetical protein